jgi:hypothetical protein
MGEDGVKLELRGLVTVQGSKEVSVSVCLLAQISLAPSDLQRPEPAPIPRCHLGAVDLGGMSV